jgi:hypothetical protein
MLDFETGPVCHGPNRAGHTGPATGPERMEALITLAEQYLAIDNDQRETWQRLTTTVRDCVEAMQIAWVELDSTESRAEDRTIARFDRLADVADVVSAAVRRLRPALEALYATLDAAQREALDSLIDEVIGRSSVARAWQ